MKGFTTDPLPFVRGTVLEWAIEEQDPRNIGLFHVTTALPAVMAHGRLMSRMQLRSVRWEGAGMGGGLTIRSDVVFLCSKTRASFGPAAPPS